MQEITVFGVTISTWIYVPVVYFVWVSVLIIIKKIIFKQIENISNRTKMRFDDILVSALDLPITLLILVSGALVVEKALPPEFTGDLLANFLLMLKATTIIAVILFKKVFIFLQFYFNF